MSTSLLIKAKKNGKVLYYAHALHAANTSTKFWSQMTGFQFNVLVKSTNTLYLIFLHLNGSSLVLLKINQSNWLEIPCVSLNLILKIIPTFITIGVKVEFCLIFIQLLGTIKGLTKYKRKSLSKRQKRYTNKGSRWKVGLILFTPKDPSSGKIIWNFLNLLRCVSCLKDFRFMPLIKESLLFRMHDLKSSTIFFPPHSLIRVPWAPLTFNKNTPLKMNFDILKSLLSFNLET